MTLYELTRLDDDDDDAAIADGTIPPDTTGEIGKLAERLRVFDVSSAFPLVFVIAAGNVTDEDNAAAYKLIVSYSVRQHVAGRTLRAWERLWSVLARRPGFGTTHSGTRTRRRRRRPFRGAGKRDHESSGEERKIRWKTSTYR